MPLNRLHQLLKNLPPDHEKPALFFRLFFVFRINCFYLGDAMKRLKYVSANTRRHYAELSILRDESHGVVGTLFTKNHKAQMEAIERMEVYLSPKKLRCDSSVRT
jgi:hypothetical protein